MRAAGDVKPARHEKTAGRLHGPRRRAPCKPGFVRGRPPPAIYLIPRLRAGFSGRTRESAGRLILPYSTLLLMGFARPAGSPRGRWALTPPFHPYRFRGGLLFCGTLRRFAFLRHFPWVRTRRNFSCITPCGARTFLPRCAPAAGSDTLSRYYVIITQRRAAQFERTAWTSLSSFDISRPCGQWRSHWRQPTQRSALRLPDM